MSADEKDRLGDKLRDVERAREEQYFAKRDRELLERMRQAKEGDTEGMLKEAAKGRCPKCGTVLQPRTLRDVKLDECPECRGMWLDKGELHEIARNENDGWIARWLRSEFRKP